MMFDKEFIITSLLAKCNESDKIEFDNKNFAYDYNEVQELYLDNNNNYFVYLSGVTGLNKTKLLAKVVNDLLKSGIAKQDIIYADFELPFIRELSITAIADLFRSTSDDPLYLIANEIGLKEDFFAEVRELRTRRPNIKLLATCSIPFLVYEHLHDNPDDYSKIIVLSPKNSSNVKSESDTFGVYGSLKYNIKNGICEIKGMTKEGKSQSKHIVPSVINGYPVKIIASGAFHHRSELVEIELPDSIEFIGDYAFTKCDNLSKIQLPKNLTYIGDCAFLGAKKLQVITGGDNVIHIGNSALYATAWLNEKTSDFVTLGKVLYQYKGKQDLVIIPEDITVLGSYAFKNTNIKGCDLAHINNIEEGCFYNCKCLSLIKNYTNSNIAAFTFYNCTSLNSIDTIITNVDKHAFYNCSSLTNLVFDNVKINEGAFENCTHLSNLTSKIIIAKKCAFYKSSISQVDLTIAEYIGEYAFYSTQLNNICLKEVKEINYYAFAGIKKLTSAYLKTQGIIKEGIFNASENIIEAEMSGKYPLSYYFNKPANIQNLIVNGDCCDNFSRNNAKLKSVTINNGKIGNWAFYNNIKLTSVKLNKCKIIGFWAFAYCDNLKEILIPKTVKYIEMNAFRYCHQLAKIQIQSITPVMFGANAFYSTSETKEIIVKNKETYLNIPIWKEYVKVLKDSSLSKKLSKA